MNQRARWKYAGVRTVLIGYGTAAFSWWFSRTLSGFGEGPALLCLLGVVVQLVLLMFDFLSRRHAGVRRWREGLSDEAVQAAELCADAITVLLFAVATFQAMLLPLNGL